jgi:hypothetical protein
MSLDHVHEDQKQSRCACPCLSSKDCIRARHPQLYAESFPWDEDHLDDYDDDRCECVCHDREHDEEDDGHGVDCNCVGCAP